MAEAIDISVIIPTHNRSDALNLTIENLAKQDFSGLWEVIVVNNNSTDNTDEIVNEWKKRFPVELTLLHEPKPGPAAARNAGASIARGGYLLFMDNDVLAGPGLLSKHYEALIRNPDCWIVGQFQNLPEQEATPFGRYRKALFPLLDSGVPCQVDYITGQGTSMPRRDFESLNGFDQAFAVASGEDRELALRAIKAGVRILFVPQIVAFHNDWAGSAIRDYCRRQRIYSQTEPFFGMKWGDANPRRALYAENFPASFARDGFRLYVWKQLKRFLGTSPAQSVLISSAEFLERLAPDSRVLWAFYRLAIAGAINRGFREGLDELTKKKVGIGVDA